MANASSQTPPIQSGNPANDDWDISTPSDVEGPEDWGAGSVEVRYVRNVRRHQYVGHRRRLFVTADLPFPMGMRTAISDTPSPSSAEELRRRLDSANRHFRRKAAAVLADEVAVRLLAELYQAFNLDLEEFDTCEYGIALSKLTAANFCEVGSKVVYITEAGQGFMEALNRA